jgi:hypothetical protein
MLITKEQKRFKDHLTEWVYSSDTIKNGIIKRKKDHAIGFNYIQLNRLYKKYLVFDIDRKASVFDWYDLKCPEPTLITANPESKHSQFIYELETPVIYTNDPRTKKRPQSYYEAVWAGLNGALKGDMGYTGLMLRNPLKEEYSVRLNKNPPIYQLKDFSEYIDLSGITKQNAAGRNSTLFDSLRYRAYQLSKNLDEQQLFNELSYLAVEINLTFAVPLPESELKSTCKSVAKWVSRKYTGSGLRRGVMKLSTELNIQEKRKLAGQFSAKAERDKSINKLKRTILERLEKQPEDVFSLKQNLVADESGLAERTIRRLLEDFHD